jgi:hypothetical protein
MIRYRCAPGGAGFFNVRPSPGTLAAVLYTAEKRQNEQKADQSR